MALGTRVAAALGDPGQCWSDYLRRLKQCEESFCAPPDGCQSALIDACIEGAKLILADCVKSQR